MDQASSGDRPGRFALVTLEEQRTDLIRALEKAQTARDRVRIEWALTKVSAEIIRLLIQERFEEQSCLTDPSSAMTPPPTK